VLSYASADSRFNLGTFPGLRIARGSRRLVLQDQRAFAFISLKYKRRHHRDGDLKLAFGKTAQNAFLSCIFRVNLNAVEFFPSLSSEFRPESPVNAHIPACKDAMCSV
jgi:hypothetical protein